VSRTMATGRLEPPGCPETGAGWIRRILFAALGGVVPAGADSASGGSRCSADFIAVSAAGCSADATAVSAAACSPGRPAAA